jgi:cytochrome P450
MAAVADAQSPTEGLQAPPSPAGPLLPGAPELPLAPAIPLSSLVQTLRLSVRQIEFVFGARRRLGEVFRMRGVLDADCITVTSHPDHVRSLFTAKPEEAPSVTGESPLRPIVGPNSTLTALGERHMRQRKLLLPAFHGDAIARYSEMIERAAEQEIERWPIGRPIALAPRMQRITLDVIMAGIFGIEGRPRVGTPEYGLREAVRQIMARSTGIAGQIAELLNTRREEPWGPTWLALSVLDFFAYAVIRARRAAPDNDERNDVLSLLLRSRAEDGELLTDRELRDELLTLVLAGHETTANQLAWTFERLVRTPAAYERLRSAVRAGGAGAEQTIDATIYESMRSRPVIPAIGRRVTVPWQLGDYGAPADSIVVMSILLLHHREDVYPDPFDFRPERFDTVKPGTYTWIPFGGGIRRCLGATLAMAEQRIVLDTVMRRTDLVAAEREPEHARHRNVTMLPARGARVIVAGRSGS